MRKIQLKKENKIQLKNKPFFHKGFKEQSGAKNKDLPKTFLTLFPQRPNKDKDKKSSPLSPQGASNVP